MEEPSDDLVVINQGNSTKTQFVFDMYARKEGVSCQKIS